jgi:hypothetical protein
VRIPLALLADSAVAHPTDGKLYVIGGGIRSLPFAGFPATHPHFALALGIDLDADELGLDHSLSIEASGASGVIVQPVAVTFRLPRPSEAKAGYFHFVWNMDNITFPTEGEYDFAISIDSQPMGHVGLRAERTGGALQSISDADVANVLLMDGYGAFSRGDRDGAEAIFRDVVQRYPNVPGGHNNLGFVLLAKADAPGALGAFSRAEKLGYPQNEISQANIACAHYLAGDFAEAFQGFGDCLRNRRLTTIGTLFGVGPTGLFPVQLKSSADYAVLMALNSAWSAHRLGDEAATSHYLEGARAGDLTLSDDEGGRLVAESVRQLEVLVAG